MHVNFSEKRSSKWRITNNESLNIRIIKNTSVLKFISDGITTILPHITIYKNPSEMKVRFP